MATSPENPTPTIRYPADLEIAEGALEGDEAAIGVVRERLEDASFRRWLIMRGASETEAGDLIGDLFTDCFAGQKARGGMHRLLGKFNGACRLSSFLRRVALHRLISLKRKQRPGVSLDADEGDGEEAPRGRLAGPEDHATEDAVVELLQEGVLGAFAEIDQEKFVLFRLFHSYRVPQKTIGEMWGWHYSKVSRNLAGLGEDLRGSILAKIKEKDPWLDLEWEDFLELCGETVDLFDY